MTTRKKKLRLSEAEKDILLMMAYNGEMVVEADFPNIARNYGMADTAAVVEGLVQKGLIKPASFLISRGSSLFPQMSKAWVYTARGDAVTDRLAHE